MSQKIYKPVKATTIENKNKDLPLGVLKEDLAL